MNSDTLENYEYLDNQLEEKWQKIKADYREKYPTITEEDVSYREGEFDDMTHRLGRRTNRSRDQIQHEIRDWDNG